MTAGDETDHVVAAIDGALSDYTLSPDAMRWSPDPPAAPRLILGAVGDVNQRVIVGFDPSRLGSDHVFAGYTFVPTRIDPAALARTGRAVARMRDSFERAAVEIGRSLAPLTAAMRRLDWTTFQPDDTDARTRALQARQSRNTGPARDPFQRRGRTR